MFSYSKKIISAMIVFVMVFSYFGGTLEAIAATDGIEAITAGFSKGNEMNFGAYFKNNDELLTEVKSDLKEKATIYFEIEPANSGKGFLKSGKITALGDNGEAINFKFSKIKNVEIEEKEDAAEIIEKEDNNEERTDLFEEDEKENEENIELKENTVSENIVENNTENIIEQNDIVENNNIVENQTSDETIENTIDEEIINDVTNEIVNETIENQNITVEENKVENDIIENTVVENEVLNITTSDIVSRENGSRLEEEETSIENNNQISNEENLINEEEIIEEKIEETEETYEEMTAKDIEISIESENQIKLENIINKTIIEAEIEYTNNENSKEINISDLYKKINLKLEGTYVNINLKKIQIDNMQSVNIGWKYHKDFEVTSQYTQISPFKLEDHQGTVLESNIEISRIVEDNEKSLPVKQTEIIINVPELDGQMPETVNVDATKLMASKGEDSGSINFSQDNWEYDKENKTIKIKVVNEDAGKAKNSNGIDTYTVIYRYNTYVEGPKILLQNTLNVTMEEYSSNENVITTKKFDETQNVLTSINNLMKCNLSSTEENFSKAKINANYNSAEAKYQSDFKTIVNLNVLTNDVIEELKVISAKEAYIDQNNTEFDATQDVFYSKVKFNYNEIKPILASNGTIEIQGKSGAVLYILTNELVQNEDACEIKLVTEEKGIDIVFKNMAINKNISIELTKSIKKSSYDKNVFNNFSAIKSYLSAEFKYASYEELYGMQEISTIKEFEKSMTNAEISLINNNLNSLGNNDNVEVHIALNNDKENTDLYVNPCFELVFPKYVKNVILRDIDLMFDSGLMISNYQTFNEDGLVKLRIELEGVETEFCESIITNGTNLVLNLDLELNEYVPKKQDQIKMYYYNEGVTNYISATEWKMNKVIPTGILRQTNGFDVAIINYKAPAGFLTVNAIQNYDGMASKIKSISQGEQTIEVQANDKAQIATMELVAMNNTGNDCTDVCLIGKIPFKNNKSVISNKNLGTTVDTKILDGITEDIQNVSMSEIYYSVSENPTKDLNDPSNDWTKEVTDFSTIKSYMIIVKGKVASGAILKYTYSFEMPVLDYEQKLYGSFGAYYNNNAKDVVSYESSEADLVGVYTKEDPNKIPKADISDIDFELETSVYESQRTGMEYEYRMFAINNSDVELEDSVITLNLNENINYKYSSVAVIKDSKISQDDDGSNIVKKVPEKAEQKIEEDSRANYDLANNKVYYTLGKIRPGDKVYITAKVFGNKKADNLLCNSTFTSKNLNEIKTSNDVSVKLVTADVIIEENEDIQSKIIDNSELEISYTIKNVSDIEIVHLNIQGTIPDLLENAKVFVYGASTGMSEIESNVLNGNFSSKVNYLYAGESVELIIRGKVRTGSEGQEFSGIIEALPENIKVAEKIYSYTIQKNENIMSEESIENEEVIEENSDLAEESLNLSSILGNVYTDINKPVSSQVQVQLLKDSAMVKATTTDENGNYKFDELSSGDYSVVFNYNKDEYTSKIDKEENVEVQKFLEIEEGTSVTETIKVAEGETQNVDLQLEEKDKFDLSMKQYIKKAIVNINEKETEYNYEDLDLAKIEISPSDLEKATVKFEYKLVVENVGNQDGQVTSIVDYVPNGLTFVESENEGWSAGTIQGNIYYNGLKGINISPGEKQEITLILSKKMNEDNTGVISNKAKIAYTESTTRLTEASENNFASQETIVTLTQGISRKSAVIIAFSMFIIVGIFSYMVQTGKLQISLDLRNGIKKVYK